MRPFRYCFCRPLILSHPSNPPVAFAWSSKNATAIRGPGDSERRGSARSGKTPPRAFLARAWRRAFAAPHAGLRGCGAVLARIQRVSSVFRRGSSRIQARAKREPSAAKKFIIPDELPIFRYPKRRNRGTFAFMEPALLRICDDSALLFWRSVGSRVPPRPSAKRAIRPSGGAAAGKPSPERIAYLPRRYPALAHEPLHLLVPRGEDRIRCKGVRCLVHAGALPRGSFCEAEENLFVLSPELCFMRLAPKLSLPHAAQLGSEFCGAYSLSDDDERSMRKRAPITHAASLRSYVENPTGERGVARARRALRHIEDGAESPRETPIALLFDLPVRLGSCGFPPPKTNCAIPLPAHVREATGKRSLLCNLL